MSDTTGRVVAGAFAAASRRAEDQAAQATADRIMERVRCDLTDVPPDEAAAYLACLLERIQRGIAELEENSRV